MCCRFFLKESSDLDMSIEDLEEWRKSLLAKLQEVDFQEESHDNIEQNQLEVMEGSLRIPDENSERNYVNSSAASIAIQSKFLSMGTPVSIRHSSYNSLPNLEKFASNMDDDLELFENLPNSTGAFGKMKSLLKTMRPGGRVSKLPELVKTELSIEECV